jgi:hypothetical protein
MPADGGVPGVTAQAERDEEDSMSEIRNEIELQRMLQETKKFIAEHDKLMAETAKLDKERWWFPWLQLLTLVVSSATIGAIVARLVP